MITTATNELNDIYLDGAGNLAMKKDLDACVQSCREVSQTLLGELPYAQSRGVAFFRVGLVEDPPLGLYEVQLRKQLLTVPNVEKVPSIAFKIEGNQLSYEARIKTSYGEEIVRGI